MNNGGSFHSYVKLPEGMISFPLMVLWNISQVSQRMSRLAFQSSEASGGHHDHSARDCGHAADFCHATGSQADIGWRRWRWSGAGLLEYMVNNG